MDVYYQVKHRLQAPTLARKFDISHWLSCGANGQAYGHVITNFLGWIDYQIFLGIGLRSKEVEEEQEESEAVICSFAQERSSCWILPIYRKK